VLRVARGRLSDLVLFLLAVALVFRGWSGNHTLAALEDAAKQPIHAALRSASRWADDSEWPIRGRDTSIGTPQGEAL
jgi:hypothetical protein